MLVTAEDWIKDLDDELAESGQDIILQRISNAPNGVQIPFNVYLRAFVRNFSLDEIGNSGINQSESKVIISPTPIIAAQWTSGRSVNEDQRVPVNNNRAIIAGKSRTVVDVWPKYFNGELVRIDLRVAG